MSKLKQLCQYCDPDNIHCHNEAKPSGYCYWHDASIDKSEPHVKGLLEQYAKAGGMLRGLKLKKGNFEGIDLVNHHKKQGYDFSYSDLYRANLKGAHLFNIKFFKTSLMKADLRDANLNCADLQQANMLGVKWAGSKFENVKIGAKLSQENTAKASMKKGNKQAAIDNFEQAEEIYRDLRKHAEHEGIFSLSGDFIQKELTMRRMQLPKYSRKRILSKVVDLFCGYGEAPLRIVGLSIGIILFCAFIYTFTGLNYQGEFLSYDSQLNFDENFSLFLSCLYYSVVTFTTLGYGDFTPVGISRGIAALEAFTGSFTIALFVVVFVKKMTR
ncbi:MAG: ion channel [Colwellia sp.]|nr:ion channel [Colwellia sp.]